MGNKTDTAIIYSSFMGTTRKVANYLAKTLDADVFDLKLQTNIDMTDYSKIIIGTGVHAGNPYGKVTRFIEDNREKLLDKEVYLFISCMYKGEKAETQCEDIAQTYQISDAVYFSTRGEKNEAGVCKDVDTFAERMGQ
ncbi:MAG: flavodoxin domain-containing protein [archaeon]|nr:flavodoxin domain-containing protein [archaeon]